jgi:hypothetical protein
MKPARTRSKTSRRVRVREPTEFEVFIEVQAPE